MLKIPNDLDAIVEAVSIHGESASVLNAIDERGVDRSNDNSRVGTDLICVSVDRDPGTVRGVQE